MLSGNCQAGPLFGVVDAGLAGIHYDTNMDQLPDNIWQQNFFLFLKHLINFGMYI